ncbi:hypothetical protein [Agrobacterium tumefaciens]|uniref:hypothetical protein n=1 Tax=Agrobacterium tumefaciens TaxID=358 RepID=UPI003BA2A159
MTALFSERCQGLASVNGYLVQDIAKAETRGDKGRTRLLVSVLPPDGARASRATLNRRDIARIMWRDNASTWTFSNAECDRSATVSNNPDYVDIIVHSGLAPPPGILTTAPGNPACGAARHHGSGSDA